MSDEKKRSVVKQIEKQQIEKQQNEKQQNEKQQNEEQFREFKSVSKEIRREANSRARSSSCWSGLFNILTNINALAVVFIGGGAGVYNLVNDDEGDYRIAALSFTIVALQAVTTMFRLEEKALQLKIMSNEFKGISRKARLLPISSNSFDQKYNMLDRLQEDLNNLDNKFSEISQMRRYDDVNDTRIELRIEEPRFRRNRKFKRRDKKNDDRHSSSDEDTSDHSSSGEE